MFNCSRIRNDNGDDGAKVVDNSFVDFADGQCGHDSRVTIARVHPIPPKKKKELPKRKSSEKFPLKELLERQQSALMNNQIISIAVKSLKQLDTKKNARLESIKEDSTHNLIAT